MEKSKQPLALYMQVFNFTLEDLEANRQGLLSEQQRQQLGLKLQKRHAPLITSLFWMVVGDGAILGLIAFIGVVIADREWHKTFIYLVVAVFFIFNFFLAVGIGLRKIGLYSRQLENEISSNQVASVCDTVILTTVQDSHGFYLHFVEVSQQKFQVTDTEFLTFANGEPYCIYYLPYTKGILSVEPNVPNSDMEKSKQHLNLFMRVFDFTSDDLTANVNGSISAYQQQKLLQQYRRNHQLKFFNVVMGIAAIVGTLALSTCALYIVDIGGAELLGFTCFLWLLTGITSIIGAGWGILKLPGYYRFKQILHHGKVASICGMVILRKENQLSLVEINNQHFSVSPDEFLTFRNGEPYCIYYLPESKAILSVRPQLKVE